MTAPRAAGAPKRTSRKAKAIVIGVVAMPLLVLVAHFTIQKPEPAPAAAAERVVLTPTEEFVLRDLESRVDTLVAAKVVARVEDLSARAWVSPAVWNATTYEQKSNLLQLLARYWAARNHAALMDYEIVDDHTGKRLALYTDHGFTVD
jgi:hypothetical protein